MRSRHVQITAERRGRKTPHNCGAMVVVNNSVMVIKKKKVILCAKIRFMSLFSSIAKETSTRYLGNYNRISVLCNLKKVKGIDLCISSKGSAHSHCGAFYAVVNDVKL
jgi:hypothetical protein